MAPSVPRFRLSLALALALALGCTTSMPGAGGAGGATGGGTATGGASGGGGSGTTAGEGGTGGAAPTGGGGESGGAAGGSGGGPSGGAGGTAIPDPGTEGDGDFTIGPTYTVSPDLMVRNVPHGRTNFMFNMNSTTSAIFPGTNPALDAANQHSFTRAIRVYVPMQYADGTAAPFLIVQDGYVPDVVTALDNLIADGRLPALVAVFVANGGGDGIGSERGLEYDTMSDAYSRFIDTEVLPAVVSNAAIKAAYPSFRLTTDPEGRGSYGCSSGGAAAMTMGWFTPGAYHRLITYSGTFVDIQNPASPEEAQYPFGAWEYPERLIANNPAKPLRVFLQVAQNDMGSTATEASHRNWVLANQHLAAALKAKGYHYRFVYALGSSHCDAAVRRQTLPDTLAWMWRGYTPAN